MINLAEHKKILFVRLGKIGDIIIASAAIEALKQKFPNIEISLFTLKKNKGVLKYNSKIDHLYLTNKNLLLFLKVLLLCKNKFDVLIDLNDDLSTTSNLIRKLIKAKIKVGYDFEGYKKPDISVTQPDKNKTHIIERVKTLLVEMNKEFENFEFIPKLYLGENEKQEVYEQLKNIKENSKIVTLNISAGAQIRYWPEKKWKELITRLLNENNNIKILILSTKKDGKLKERISKNVHKVNLIPQNYYSFQHFASYICYSDILITPDTAAVHIASAFDVPVVALFPNYEWNFISWQPLSNVHRSLRSKSEKISDISVDEVYNSFKDILSEIEK